eukprot:4791953-Amphidinium_carterae.1
MKSVPRLRVTTLSATECRQADVQRLLQAVLKCLHDPIRFRAFSFQGSPIFAFRLTALQERSRSCIEPLPQPADQILLFATCFLRDYRSTPWENLWEEPIVPTPPWVGHLPNLCD